MYVKMKNSEARKYWLDLLQSIGGQYKVRCSCTDNNPLIVSGAKKTERRKCMIPGCKNNEKYVCGKFGCRTHVYDNCFGLMMKHDDEVVTIDHHLADEDQD